MGDFADDCYRMASGEDSEEPSTRASITVTDRRPWAVEWDRLRDRAEQAERERDRLRERSGRAEAALERIANNGCGIPGHAVAVGCGSDYEAAATLAALSPDAEDPDG